MKRWTPVGPVPQAHGTVLRHRQAVMEMSATVALAMMLHIVGLLAWYAFRPQAQGDEWFSTIQVTREDAKQVVLMVAPPPPPPAPPSVPASALKRPPGSAPAPGRRGPMAGPPRPIQGPAQGAPRPRILAAQNAKGSTVPYEPRPVAAPPSSLTRDPGIPEGRPGAGGQGGPGSGGQGNYGSGTGGPGGTGGSGGSGGGGHEQTYSVIDYDRFRKLGLEDVTPQQLRALGGGGEAFPRTWPDFCRAVGIDYANDLLHRPSVVPVFTYTFMPPLSGRDMIGRQEGHVGLTVTIRANGSAETAISTSSGDTHLDSIGYSIGKSMFWLPALQSGRPVDCTVTFVVHFRTDKVGGYVQENQSSNPAQPSVPPSPAPAPGGRS